MFFMFSPLLLTRHSLQVLGGFFQSYIERYFAEEKRSFLDGKYLGFLSKTD